MELFKNNKNNKNEKFGDQKNGRIVGRHIGYGLFYLLIKNF